MNWSLFVVVCRRGHFTSSIFLKFGYVLQMGIKFWKFETKVAPQIWVMGFGTPENANNGLLGCFWGSRLTSKRHECIFHRKLKSLKNPLEW